MDRTCKVKCVIVKAMNIIAEMNANASRKWHPEKETVGVCFLLPPDFESHFQTLSIEIHMNGYDMKKVPAYKFIVNNEKHAIYCKVEPEGKEEKFKDITFGTMIDMLEKIKNGEGVE